MNHHQTFKPRASQTTKKDGHFYEVYDWAARERKFVQYQKEARG